MLKIGLSRKPGCFKEYNIIYCWEESFPMIGISNPRTTIFTWSCLSSVWKKKRLSFFWLEQWDHSGGMATVHSPFESFREFSTQQKTPIRKRFLKVLVRATLDNLLACCWRSRCIAELAEKRETFHCRPNTSNFYNGINTTENLFIVKAAFRGNPGSMKKQNSRKRIDLCAVECCDH